MSLRALLLVIVAALLPAVAAHAQTPLEREAADYLTHGKTDAVLRLYTETAQLRAGTGSKVSVEQVAWSPDEAALLARTWLRKGEFALARAVLQRHVQGKAPHPAAVRVWAEVLRLSGRHAERLNFLVKTAPLLPGDVPLRVLLGEALYEAGKSVEARQLLDPLAELFQDGKLQTVDEHVAVAKSLALNGFARDALTVLTKAEEQADQPAEIVQVQLALGELYVSKYNYRDGDRALKRVLAIDPKHIGALVGMARIDVQSDHDIARARKRLDAALQENPRDLDLLAMRAEIALHDEDLDGAAQWLDKARSQRPDYLPMLYVQGARCKLADDAKCWTETEQAVRKISKDNGQLYLVAASYLELNHRYREVRTLLETALQRDRDLWPAHAALGMAYAREADDGKAQKSLETAYSGDPFDVRTANQLSVLYDDALKNMQLLPGKNADLRVAKKERKALERTVLPFLQEAVEKLSAAYGFAPKRPLQVEIFPDLQQFSVRTVGLPQLGAHAVCFGHLVTSRSPLAEPFNWKMVLYHELSHVFHIQATDGRVPRWLTEGLAMMESAWADPDWQQHGDRRAYDRLLQGKLATLDKFNLAFSQARSMQDILDAYDQSMREVAFLADQFGRDKVRKLVSGHQPGKTTAQLIREVLGQEPAALDKAFAAWLRKDLKRFDRDFAPTVTQVAQRLGLAARPDFDPNDATDDKADDKADDRADDKDDGDREPAAPPATRSPLRQALADAVVVAMHGRNPTQRLQKVLALAGPGLAKNGAALGDEDLLDVCTAQWLLMPAQVQRDPKAAAERAAWLAGVRDGRCDGVTVRTALAAVAHANKQPGEEIAHLRRALAIDPTDDAASRMMLAFAEKAAEGLAGEPTRAAWWDALGRPDATALRVQIETVATVNNHDARGPALLARLAWLAWQRAGQGADKSKQVAWLERAQSLIEGREPGGRLAPLYEARLAVARGTPAMALAPYRLAAERGQTAVERAEAWCEAATASAAAKAPEDQAEAARRCAAEKPLEAPRPAPRPIERPVPPVQQGGVPPGGT